MRGEFEKAMINFDRAVSLRPNVAGIYGHRSLARIAMGDDSGAERDARRALELDSELIDGHLAMARANARQSDLGTAMHHFNRAVDLAPDDAGVYWWRARFYRDTIRNGTAAFSDLNRAIELRPSSASFYLDRGILLYQTGNYAEAKSDLQEAISLSQDPKLPDVIQAAESWLDAVEEQAPGVVPVTPPPDESK